MKPVKLAVLILILATPLQFARGQVTPATGQPVSRDEYNKLQGEHEKLKQQLEVLKAQMQELSNKGAPKDAAPTKAQTEEQQKKMDAQKVETDQAIGELETELKKVKQMAKDSFPGTSKMLLSGYGSATFSTTRDGYGPAMPVAPDSREAHSSFTATFNPIFLWKLSDRLLFEGEMEMELEGSETSVALEMAQVSYLLNDYMTIGAGKFLNPIDYFVERQHMAWVNKFPDKPLAVYDGLLPESLLGVQMRGAVPLGSTKLSYAFYAANAPSLNLGSGPAVSPDLGTLGFENFDNGNDHIAVGGRVGFFPIPELEIGYGFQSSSVGPPGSGINSLLHSTDLTYVRESERLKGIVNLHAQWVWSDVNSYTYDADKSLGFGPFDFNNNRNGGYVQLAYRPTRAENQILKNLEPVVRYDMINQRKTPVGFDERRWSFGLDYWLGASTVVKAAFERDHQDGIGRSGNAFLLQFATGF